MKKILFVSFFVFFCAAVLSANELGVGYNNGGPSLRFKWDDSVTSELGMIINYSNDAASSMASTEIILSLAPINLALYRGELGAVNLGFVFKDRIVYMAGRGVNATHIFTANDYSLNILLPELELNFPGVKGLTIIGAIGLGTSWGYAENGKLDSFRMNLFGISMASVGIVYYFDLGGRTAVNAVPVPAAAKPVAVPAAKPAAAPASTGAAPVQAKETPVK